MILSKEYGSIIHFNNGSGWSNVGARIPFVYYRSPGTVCVTTHVGTDWTRYLIMQDFDLHTWHSFVIEQSLVDSKVVLTLSCRCGFK